jgi:hypothetical protein
MPKKFADPLTPVPGVFARNLAEKERIAIVALDGLECHVRAHYNPAEVQLEKTVAWTTGDAPGEESPYMEYKKPSPRTLSMELFFDCSEQRGRSVQPELDALATMAVPQDPSDLDHNWRRRPPLLEIVNGPIPAFRCVISSISVKLTRFDRQMQPTRATVSIKVTEVYDDSAGNLIRAREMYSKDMRENAPALTGEQRERAHDAELRRRELATVEYERNRAMTARAKDERVAWVKDQVGKLP